MDTSGFATLIEAMRLARQQNTQILLRGVQDQPRYLFKVSELDRVFIPDLEGRPAERKLRCRRNERCRSAEHPAAAGQLRGTSFERRSHHALAP